MNWNHWVRQIHRWLSIAFTLAVLLNFGAIAVGSQAMWVGFVAVVPLIPMLFSGLYLLALPWFAKRKTALS